MKNMWLIWDSNLQPHDLQSDPLATAPESPALGEVKYYLYNQIYVGHVMCKRVIINYVDKKASLCSLIRAFADY